MPIRYAISCCAVWLASLAATMPGVADADASPPIWPFSIQALVADPSPLLQWDNVISDWPLLTGPASLRDAQSGLYLLPLERSNVWEVRLAPNQPLRLHAPRGKLCSGWRAAVSRDGKLFIDQEWTWRNTREVVLDDTGVAERVVRLSLSSNCREPAALFVGRLRISPAWPALSAVEQGAESQVRYLHDFQSGSSRRWLHLPAGSSLTMDLPAAAEIGIESRYDYSFEAVPARYAYKLKYAVDDASWSSLRLDARPDYGHALRVEGSDHLLGESETRFLQLPSGSRRLHLQSAAPQWLRIHSYDPSAWVLSANRPIAHNNTRDAVIRWQKAQALAAANSDEAELQAAEYLAASPWGLSGMDDLHRYANNWLANHTFFEPLPPLTKTRLDDQKVSVARLARYSGGEPRLYADPRFAPLLEQQVTRGLFAPLTSTGLTYALPPDAAGLHLRLLLRGVGALQLWAAADNGKPFALHLRAESSDALRTPPAAAGAALNGTIEPALVSAAEFIVPAFAQSLRVWHEGAPVGFDVSLQQRRLAALHWNEHDFRALGTAQVVDSALTQLTGAIAEQGINVMPLLDHYPNLAAARRAQALHGVQRCTTLWHQVGADLPWSLRNCPPPYDEDRTEFLRAWRPMIEQLQRARMRFYSDLPPATSVPLASTDELAAAVMSLDRAGLGGSADRLLRGQVLYAADQKQRDAAARLLTVRLVASSNRGGQLALLAVRVSNAADIGAWLDLADWWLQEDQASAAAALLSLLPPADRPPALTRQVAAMAGWSVLLEQSLSGASVAEAQIWRRYAASAQQQPDVLKLPEVLPIAKLQDRTALLVRDVEWRSLLNTPSASLRAAAKLPARQPVRLHAAPGETLRIRLLAQAPIPMEDRGWVELRSQGGTLIYPLQVTEPIPDWIGLDTTESVYSAGSFQWTATGEAELYLSHPALLIVEAESASSAPFAVVKKVSNFTSLSRPPQAPVPVAAAWPAAARIVPASLPLAARLTPALSELSSDCTKAQQQGVMLLWQAEHADNTAAEAAGAQLLALAQTCGQTPGISALLSRLALTQEWEAVDQARAGAGARPLQLQAGYRHGPSLRALYALLPPLGQGEQRLAGTEALGLQLDAAQQRYVRVTVRLDPSPAQSAQALTLRFLLDGQLLRESKLDVGATTTLTVPIPIGMHVLAVSAPDNYSGQLPLLRLEEQRDGRWQALALNQTQVYLLATPAEPLVPDIEGPAWVRIERYAEPEPAISFQRLAASEMLKMSTEDSEAAYRVFRYRRLEGLPKRQLPVTLSPPVFAVRGAIPPSPRKEGTAPRDPLALGGQEDATWIASLRLRSLQQESDTDEGEEATTQRRRDWQLGLNRLQLHQRSGLYENLGGLLRMTDTGSPVLGVTGSLNGYPPNSPWSWQARASLLAQYLDTVTGSRELASALRVNTDLHHRWSWEKLAHAGSLGVRTRWQTLSPMMIGRSGADPQVSSGYTDQHPWALAASSRWQWDFSADAKAYTSLNYLSNSDWNLARLDRWSWEAGWAQWWRPMVLRAAIRERFLLADRDRSSGRSYREALLSLDWDRRVSADARLGLSLGVQLAEAGSSSIALQLSWIFDHGRGARDEPPAARLFSKEQDRADLDLTR